MRLVDDGRQRQRAQRHKTIIMSRLSTLLVMWCFAVAVIECAMASDESTNSSAIIRKRRYLDFIPKSRMFFRANVKENLLTTNQILAYAYGYRANYPIENGVRTKRSEVFDTIEELISQHGFDGRACILKTFCDASQSLTPKSGMFFKLFKLIFRFAASDVSTGSNSIPDGDLERYPYLGSDDCSELLQHCPLNLFSIAPHTDV